MVSSSISDPIPVLTPELFDRLREQVENTVLRLIKKNRHTRYLCESPVFCDFRRVLDTIDTDIVNDESLVETFRATIPLTGYDSYEAFVNQLAQLHRLFERDIQQEGETLCKVSNCVVYSLLYKDIIQVVDDEQTIVGQFPVTPMSGGVIRMQNGMDVHLDPWIISKTAPRATSPIAVSFICNYRSFLLMHALFALADPQLETITTLFGTVFVDMIRCMEEEWDLFIDSIETGVLPRWEGTDHVQQYLEAQFTVRPEQAAHLRAVGKATDEPGWLKKLWPGLNVVVGVASGAFSVIIPKMQHYLGPDVHMSSLGFTASEAYVGTAYSPTDISLFKAMNDDIIEYLDLSKSETASNLAFAHEVEVGHRYEIIVTTRDGLWRYRLGDVIEIAGFDAIDGSPILRYIERRGNVARVAGALVSEDALAHAVFSAQGILGRITEFTVIVDDRKTPNSLIFLVEVDGALSPLAHEAPARIETELRLIDENVAGFMDYGRLGPPTVHVLKPGTFREYRALKIKAAMMGAGQVKVPVVLWDREVQEWVLERVDRVIARR